jgi:glycosyltransferase involved in cell wall biosynthesis
MKIGLYGSIASNMYLFAKALRFQGHNAIYFHDSEDKFVFSQPWWQEERFYLDYESVMASASGDKNSLSLVGGKKNPSWVITTDSLLQKSLLEYLKSTKELFKSRAFLYVLRKYKKSVSILKEFDKCDYLIVCGIEGIVLAAAANKPFIIWPHGADIRFAAGLNNDSSSRLRAKVFNGYLSFLLKDAFARAILIGQLDPNGVGGGLVKVPFKISHLPIPYIKANDFCLEKKELREKLSNELGISLFSGATLIVVPSRIDYFWKGTDWLLKPLSDLDNDNIQFLFTGWGRDYDDFKSHFDDNKKIIFLEYAVSKPILIDLYRAADLVIDQFKFGAYGTSGLEALSCGTPLLVNFDTSGFGKHGWPEPPPIINIQNRDELDLFFTRLGSNAINLGEIALKTRAWADRELDPHKICKATMSIFLAGK